MQPGRVVLVALVTSALTSAGAFFALRALVGRGEAAPVLEMPVPAPATAPDRAPALRPVTTEQLRADDAEPTARAASALAARGAAAAADGAPARGADEAAAAPTLAGAPLDPAQAVIVPRVTRLPLAAARRALEQAGFVVSLTYSYDEDVSEGRILRQVPPAGARAARGSSVKLVVNKD